MCGGIAALPSPVAVFLLLLMTNREKTKQFLLVSPTAVSPLVLFKKSLHLRYLYMLPLSFASSTPNAIHF